ncbi:nuclear transport factor 2 family protein [Novosphingobium sp. PS1R-30]|uniref:Nuclear transport factor 2 family protein n=1 Tax=Novosphingobium anseongense TaxID=3133436 RepID=A0ABU8S2D5_9SPHN|nr:MAG: nuclear transport factor 2 family protein [Novosphingobium sp.]
MTDEELKDRIAIGDRLAACTQAGDARKADAYAECFAEDGVLQLDETIAGREAIRAWMRGPSPIPPPKGEIRTEQKPVGFISHHLTTSKVDLLGDGTAKARTYWLVTSAAGLDHNGYYDDLLRQENGAWLIAHRRPRTLWISPDSLLRG